MLGLHNYKNPKSLFFQHLNIFMHNFLANSILSAIIFFIPDIFLTYFSANGTNNYHFM